MYETSVFNIKINFKKSYRSYIYDQTRQRYFLDFFGLYASLPLGYNHPVFNEKTFLRDYLNTSTIKLVNCEVLSDLGEKFLEEFKSVTGTKRYQHFWFCCTGALAIETAIKTAIEYKKVTKPVVISLKESFHGISGYGSFVTDNFPPVGSRLVSLPNLRWPKIHNPKLIYKDGKIDKKANKAGLKRFVKEFASLIKKNKGNVVALLIEPIQATFGDNHFPREFFSYARKLCDREDIALIFDEVQTGFGGTGKMWYWEHIGIEPDIVAFGKKTQVSGIMVKKKFGTIFDNLNKLSVTFDGDLTDMIRCRQILKAYTKYNILSNVSKRGAELKAGLLKIKQLKNVRGEGLLVAFDFENHEQQVAFSKKAFENGLIFNRTRETTIRLRPNLNVSFDEVEKAVSIIKLSIS